MHRRVIFSLFPAILCTAIVLWSQDSQSQPPRSQAPQIVAIRAGRLFDSKAGQVLAKQVVLVSGERITEVGPEDRVKIPSGVRVIDLSQATVLPGLIDTHTHIFSGNISRIDT